MKQICAQCGQLRLTYKWGVCTHCITAESKIVRELAQVEALEKKTKIPLEEKRQKMKDISMRTEDEVMAELLVCEDEEESLELWAEIRRIRSIKNL